MTPQTFCRIPALGLMLQFAGNLEARLQLLVQAWLVDVKLILMTGLSGYQESFRLAVGGSFRVSGSINIGTNVGT